MREAPYLPDGGITDHILQRLGTELHFKKVTGCHQPLGLSSRKIKDSQISASGHFAKWARAQHVALG
ncbi:hypothetical protein GDO81_003590 [Engystomops pustulosus]|uniref:Uncharacterized protein n=1 Tax=Engystomops pustulosus TaxID=76066 RepID=A0AAV6ZX44_ENGPU|nr:hypothetical protein GDO81_003590 [Engystomops pustulosus]